MKVTFYCNSGANSHSERSEEFDTKDLGYSDEEWKNMTSEEKYKEAERWAWERLEIRYKEEE